jgi:ABC-type multidrug transport system ATPase subunit
MTPKSPSKPLEWVLQASQLHWDSQGQRLWSFDSLVLPPGVTWVGGGEGRGKTSLLRTLAADSVSPTGPLALGDAAWQDQPDAYRQRVFWIDPKSEAHNQISALQFFANTAARYPTWDAELLTHLSEVLGLLPHQEKPLYMLSTGSKRKVWLAAALASGARLTLLDMPFAALDQVSIAHILEFLRAAAQHPRRAWVVADYVAPPGVPLAHSIDLGV